MAFSHWGRVLTGRRSFGMKIKGFRTKTGPSPTMAKRQRALPVTHRPQMALKHFYNHRKLIYYLGGKENGKIQNPYGNGRCKYEQYD